MARTVRVSDEVYEKLRKIKDEENHKSIDSVLRKLLGLKPFVKGSSSPKEVVEQA